VLQDTSQIEDAARGVQKKGQEPKNPLLHKHKIDIMVLSKIDPYDTAFPVPSPEPHTADLTVLNQSFLAGLQQSSVKRQKEKSPERKPFKQTSKIAKNVDLSPLRKDELQVSKKATNKGLQNSIESQSDAFEKTQTTFMAPIETKYGKGFRIPELPPVLQA